MGGLVIFGTARRGLGGVIGAAAPPSPLIAVPNVTTHAPINSQCTKVFPVAYCLAYIQRVQTQLSPNVVYALCSHLYIFFYFQDYREISLAKTYG